MKEPEAWEAAYMEMQEEIARHGKVMKKGETSRGE